MGIFQGSLSTFDAASGGLYAYYSSGGVIASYSDNSGTLAQLISSGSVLLWRTGGTEKMRLDASGNLGINTSSPASKLDIADASGAAPSLRIVNSVAGAWMRLTGTSASTSLFDVNGLLAIRTGASYTTAVTIDASQNMGLGVTPSAWLSSIKALDIGTRTALWSGGAGQPILGYNCYINSAGNFIYKATAAANYYVQDGAHSWYTAASGTAGNAITFTQAMTLDASGNLGVGTTSPTVRVSVATASGGSWFGAKSGANSEQLFGSDASGNASIFTQGSNTIILYTNSLERARISSDGTFRVKGAGTAGSTDAFQVSASATASAVSIDSSGNLLVGTTSAVASERLNVTGSVANNLVRFTNSNAAPYGFDIKYSVATPNGTSNEFGIFADATATRFTFRSNGGLVNYSANNVNLSDRREKTNFAPAGSYLDKICAIPVQTFNYIDQNMEDDGGLTLGVVAQDVQAVAPELIHESNWGSDEAPKMRLSIYQTDLQYALMKCIQEQQAIIESLKARLDAANL
jgi:hypothetical protein